MPPRLYQLDQWMVLMSQDGEPTVSADSRLMELENQAGKDKEALEKLLVAYQSAEGELSALKSEIEVLNREIVDKEIEKEGLESLLSEKDLKIRDIEVQNAKSKKTIEYLEPKLEKTQEMLNREEARTGRIMDVAEELHESNKTAEAELAARDDWYVQHMQLFEDLNQAIQLRYEMIDRAISAAKEIAAKSDTFREQREAVIDAIKERDDETSEESQVESDEE